MHVISNSGCYSKVGIVLTGGKVPNLFNSIQVIHAKKDGYFKSTFKGMGGGVLAQSVPLHRSTVQRALKGHRTNIKCGCIDHIIKGD